MDAEAVKALNKNWKTTCKIIFGEEVGELSDFKDWLSEFVDPIRTWKSSRSGRDVPFAIPYYSESSKRISFEEIELENKFEPLSINELKDIDSISEAVTERAYYTGGIVLGNSKGIVGSTSVNDSFYVLDSSFISESKYVAYTSFLRYSESVFGVNNDVKSNFLIRGFNPGEITRGCEVWDCYFCSDIYFSLGCIDSRDCMFSFNLSGKSNTIGNFELEKGKYLQIKKDLLRQMADELRRNKRLPSLLELVGKPHHDEEAFAIIRERAEIEEDTSDKKPIENSFSETTKVIFRKPLARIDDYEKWLMENVRGSWTEKSAISGRPIIVADMIPGKFYPEDRLVKRAEALKSGEILKLGKEEAETINLGNAKERLGKIAYFYTELRLKKNFNVIDTAMSYNAMHCYKGALLSNVKYSAFSFWPRNSQHIYGSNTSFSCSSCINTYFSNNISRSFEIDCSNKCSGSHFLHNCENVNDSMFCFNVKNLKNAIGNATLPPDKFQKIRSSILEQIHSELEAKKSLKSNIYDISSVGRKKS
ncbi:MAG: hypothetical protein V1909_00275 [Candidatus Micrarchaeota archaeon]